MNYNAYASAYPCDLTPAQIHRGEHAPYISQAQDYSYYWGRVVHCTMGTETDTSTGFFKHNYDREYYDWLFNGGFADMAKTLASQPRHIAAHGLNELNFHRLNARMLWLWIPFTQEGWRSDRERVELIDEAQHKLAIDGLLFYANRDQFVEYSGGTHALFEEENLEIHEAITGVMQEIDGAIVLLDVIRKYKDWVVLPAPLQFERTHKRVNVDFIMADIVKKRAIGIQVKSRVRVEDHNKADPDRVIFLDGDIDLGNVRVVRKRKTSSNQSPTAWPGIVAAKKVDAIKGYGQHTRYFEDQSVIPKLKLAARNMVGDLRVDHRALATLIGERVLQRM